MILSSVRDVSCFDLFVSPTLLCYAMLCFISNTSCISCSTLCSFFIHSSVGREGTMRSRFI